MKNISVPVLTALVITLCSGCSLTEQEENRILALEGRNYYVEDFVDFLSYLRPTTELPMERVIIESYLDDFIDHKLLLYHALEAGSAEEEPASVGQELRLIQQMLEQSVFSSIHPDEEKLRTMFEGRKSEKRVEIKSLYLSDQRAAQNQLRRLRGNPEEFEQAMERYNPEGMKEANFGQGIFSASQLPEEWRDSIFALNRPGIVGPIEIPNGFILVKVIDFLEGPSFTEKRDELELVYMTQQRDKLREELIRRLKQELVLEFTPEKILNNPAYTIQ